MTDRACHFHLKDVLSVLGERLGVGSLILDDDGVARLIVGDVVVDVQASAGAAWVSVMAGVCELPPEPSGEELLKWLSLPLESRDMAAGVCLVADREAGEVLACQTLPVAGLSEESLTAAIEGVVSLAESWDGAGEARTDQPPVGVAV